MRIALCGYTGEHDGEMTAAGWTPVYWKAHGGYGTQAGADGRGRANAHREVIWFGPHCLGADTIDDFQPSLFGDDGAGDDSEPLD